MKKYTVKAGDSDVFAVSLVESPAVESNFVALAKDEKPKTVMLSKEDRHMLYGIILRADFPIYRYDADMGEYYIEFGADAIERLERKYMKNFTQKEWTTDHMQYVNGLTLTESWLVEDPENDKSKALGLEGVTKGSWIGGCLVDDNELWAEIKEGRFKGFSVEAWVDLEEVTKEIKNKRQEQMKEKGKFEEIFDKVKEIVLGAIEEEKEEKPQDVQTEQVEMEEEPIKEEVKEEETAAEAPVEAEEKTEETVEEAEQPKAEETEEPQEETAPVEEEPKEDFSAQITEMQTQIDALKAENEKLKEENVKLSKQPSVKPVSSKTENTGVKGALAALRAQGIII